MNNDNPDAIGKIVGRFSAGWPPSIDVGTGWFGLLTRLDERLSAIAPEYVVQQVKSKFGSLCFYARPSEDPQIYDEAFSEEIRAAEWKSTETCEVCGAAARGYTIRMWVWTLCEHHAWQVRSGRRPGTAD